MSHSVTRNCKNIQYRIFRLLTYLQNIYRLQHRTKHACTTILCTCEMRPKRYTCPFSTSRRHTGGSRGTTTLILNIGVRWRFTPRPLTLGKSPGTHWTGGVCERKHAMSNSPKEKKITRWRIGRARGPRHVSETGNEVPGKHVSNNGHCLVCSVRCGTIK